MIARIEGLSYRNLDDALQHVGFVQKESEGSRLYLHTKNGAFLTYPILPLDDAVTAFHYVSAQKTVDSFGIMDEKDFDLLLIRLKGAPIPALTK